MAQKPRSAVDVLPMALPVAKGCIERILKFAKSVKEQGDGALSEEFYLDTNEADALLVCVSVADAYFEALQKAQAPARPLRKVILQ